MNQLYVLIVGLAALFAAGAAWVAQDWRYEGQIADLQAQHAQAMADAHQKAADMTAQMQRNKDEAIEQANQRAQRHAANAAAARRTADGLRDNLYAFRASLPSLAQPAAAVAADTAAELFGQCAGALTDLAVKADAHASDALMLQQAWPR